MANREYGFWVEPGAESTFINCIAVSGNKILGEERLPVEVEAFLRSLEDDSSEDGGA